MKALQRLSPVAGSQKPPIHGDRGYLQGTEKSTRLGLKGFPFLGHA